MECITLALAKGRTAKGAIAILKRAGFHFADFHEKSRKLVFYDTKKQIKLIFVKAVDVPTYVDKGAADIGIAGKDNIMEAQVDLYELLDLKLGKCKFAVAGLPDQKIDHTTVLTVASKYPNVAEHYFEQKGITVDTIKLNGSVELAPLIGMADVIVDIVETGNTINENGLTIIEDMEPISTRLIVNKASFATKTKEIQQIIKKLESVLE
ncbi:ATP phosphoribosyltransferase [Virgibacillus alimentarius]|uniref:ATP phosphoribosyltransferase n=1 Tax=Virgibacillus alimentarius TaxID=698769 RepID=A0ABS4S6Z7_9BACI|nr:MULTISPECIES: ATP phosphoribosyltransferase [Virgibacillus]MBP2257252.1 ATP phosphoribosyltransferase [Virgibacillus alimentarius]HLR67366.1 ATP phosphoribosyltransferase [Virgibacillus sp.]